MKDYSVSWIFRCWINRYAGCVGDPGLSSAWVGSSQDVFWILDFQVDWVKSRYVVCVLDPGHSGAWTGLVCGMCWRSWTLVPLC